MTRKIISRAVGNISSRHIEEAADFKMKAKKSVWKKWGAMAACFAVMFFTVFSLFTNYTDRKDTSSFNDFNNGITDSHNDEHRLPNDSGVTLVVNQLNAPPAMADVDVQLTHYEKLPYDVWQTIEEEFYTFANISYDDFVVLIPEEFSVNMFYSLATKGYKDAELDAEYRLHDYVFDCQSNNGAQVKIALCDFEAPIRDYFIRNENPEVSDVNGTPVTIYGYDNMYMVNFSYEGINYDVETKDMDLNQLWELLANIVSQKPTE